MIASTRNTWNTSFSLVNKSITSSSLLISAVVKTLREKLTRISSGCFCQTTNAGRTIEFNHHFTIVNHNIMVKTMIWDFLPPAIEWISLFNHSRHSRLSCPRCHAMRHEPVLFSWEARFLLHSHTLIYYKHMYVHLYLYIWICQRAYMFICIGV